MAGLAMVLGRENAWHAAGVAGNSRNRGAFPGRGAARQRALMPPRLHQVAADRGLAELLAGLEPVQALDQDEALAVRPHQDRGLLAVLQHALGDLAHARGVERRAALHRHVDVRDRKNLGLQHADALVSRAQCAVKWCTAEPGPSIDHSWTPDLRPGNEAGEPTMSSDAPGLPELHRVPPDEMKPDVIA